MRIYGALLDRLVVILGRLRPTNAQRFLFWAALTGLGGALATLAFRGLLGLAERLLYHGETSLVRAATALPAWERILVPTLGGAVAGAVLVATARLGRRTRHGDYMEAVVLGDGLLDTRESVLRALASATTVVTGGAIGREGPMVQLAALSGSLLARWRGLPVPSRRLLVACGAAAGLSAAYGAPVSAALFIAEIVLDSLATDTLAALLVASGTAHLAVALTLGEAALYRMPAVPALGVRATLLCAVIGLLAGFGAPLYLAVLDLAKRGFAHVPGGLVARLALGGFVVGLLALLAPQVWGNGFSVVQGVLASEWSWRVLAALLVLKVLAVAATTGSGAVGGIFTPTLLVGAIAGSLAGVALNTLLPGAMPLPAAAAVGMGAFLAASTHAPLMSVLMVFEMTGTYAVVVPLMLACVVGASAARMLRPASIYASSEAARDRAQPRLAIARDLVRPEEIVVRPGEPIELLEEHFLRTRWRHLYVVGDSGAFLGVIALHDLTPLLRPGLDRQAPWPSSLLGAHVPVIDEHLPLWAVLERFSGHKGERLPVLDAQGQLLGHVAKTDLLLMLRDRLSPG